MGVRGSGRRERIRSRRRASVRPRRGSAAAGESFLSAAAATHLHPQGLTVVVEGDAAAIRADLEAAALGDIVTADV